MANPEFETQYRRKSNYGQRPYSDFSGTTNAVAATQTLFAHGLKDVEGKAIVPSFIEITAGGNAVVYEVSANHTATQADIRASVASTPFRARAWA